MGTCVHGCGRCEPIRLMVVVRPQGLCPLCGLPAFPMQWHWHSSPADCVALVQSLEQRRSGVAWCFTAPPGQWLCCFCCMRPMRPIALGTGSFCALLLDTSTCAHRAHQCPPSHALGISSDSAYLACTLHQHTECAVTTFPAAGQEQTTSSLNLHACARRCPFARCC